MICQTAFLDFPDRVFTFFVSLEIFLEAVFLWITPFVAALSIRDMAVPSEAFDCSRSFDSTASKSFFTEVFSCDFTLIFPSLLFSLCLILFSADLVFAKI